MKHITQHILVVLLVMASFAGMAQQDPQFNQYMFNPMGVNPAYAGSRDVVSAMVLNRTQWLGFRGAPNTQTFAIHGPLLRKKVGLGMQVTNDIIGPRNTIHLNGVYAYRIRLGHGRLAFGLRGGILQYRINPERIDYRDVDDPFADMPNQVITRPNFDFGMYYNTTKFYVGAEIAHLNQPSISFMQTDGSANGGGINTLQYHLTGTMGKAFVLNRYVVFRPSVLVKQPGTQPGIIDINANFLFHKVLWLGGGYRHNYGAIIIAEYTWNKKFRLGYSFDYAFNPLFAQSYGSHEIFFGIDFDISRSRMISPRYF